MELNFGHGSRCGGLSEHFLLPILRWTGQDGDWGMYACEKYANFKVVTEREPPSLLTLPAKSSWENGRSQVVQRNVVSLHNSYSGLKEPLR